MRDWRSAAVLGSLGCALLAVSAWAPREPPFEDLAAQPNPEGSGVGLVVDGHCAMVLGVETRWDGDDGSTSRYRYHVCGPLEWLTDAWSVDVTLREPARVASWRVSGGRGCAGESARCTIDVGPWEWAAVVAYDGAGVPLARPALIVGHRVSGLNLRVSDVARLAVVGVLGLMVLGWLWRRPSLWAGRGAELVVVGAGLLAGALAAGRPVAWGGAPDLGAVAGTLSASLALIFGLRLAVSHPLRGGRTPARLALWTLWTGVACAFGASVEALANQGRWPMARDWQGTIIVTATAWTALTAATGRGAARAWVVGTLFGLAAAAIDALLRPPMPLPGVFGLYKPWELISIAWPIAAIAPALVRLRGLDARPARWTRPLALPLARLAHTDAITRTARDELGALIATHAGRRLPVPNVATAGFVFALAHALGRPLATRPEVQVARSAVPLVLVEIGLRRPVRGRLTLACEPRAALFEGEVTLAVRDQDRPATPAFVASVRAVIRAVDDRLGAPRASFERIEVGFEHPGDELAGRSFELPLALAWYGLRTGRRPRLGALATGRIASDRDTVLAIDGLAEKLTLLAPGEVLLAPGTQADVARQVDGIVVLEQRAGASTWRVRRRARDQARRGARVVVLVPTVGAALELVFGASDDAHPTWRQPSFAQPAGCGPKRAS